MTGPWHGTGARGSAQSSQPACPAARRQGGMGWIHMDLLAFVVSGAALAGPGKGASPRPRRASPVMVLLAALLSSLALLACRHPPPASARLVYQLDAPHAREGGDALARAAEVAERRLAAIGGGAAKVGAGGHTLEVTVPGGGDALARAKEALAPVGHFEMVLIDDQVDLFDPAEKRAPGPPPAGIDIAAENAPLGPGNVKPVHFARALRAQGESMRDALKRLAAWAQKVDAGADHRVGFGVLHEVGEGARAPIGWRTYSLLRQPEVAGPAIRDAEARGDATGGGWSVMFELTPPAAARFEEMTARNLKRRFAIVVDDEVESAPVIQQKIAGGRGQITMGAAGPDEQRREAMRLAAILRSGELPAPLVLVSQ